MDITSKLMEAIPLLEGENKKIIQDLLVKKLEEEAQAVERPPELTKEERDFEELLNYNGGLDNDRKQT